MSTMMERLSEFLDKRFTDVSAKEKRWLGDFVESEVRLALQPREQAPGLAEAESRLRNTHPVSELDQEHRKAIADELDRLRGEIETYRGMVASLREQLLESHRMVHEDCKRKDAAMRELVRSLGGEP
jgi:hypothetical protein